MPDWHLLFRYDPATGQLWWKKRKPGRQSNKPVGHDNGWGYFRVMVEGKLYLVHRIIYEMHHGPIPEDRDIDHINRFRDDNRIGNLRLATRSENRCNHRGHRHNTSGYTGVSWYKAGNKWSAYIKRPLGKKHLGYFTSKEDAIAARQAAEEECYGEFRPRR